MINPRSIRFRLTAWYAVLLTGCFSLVGFGIHAALEHQLERNLSDFLTRRASLIDASLLAQIDDMGEDYVRNEIKTRFTPELSGRFIRITRADGSLLYLSGQPRGGSFDPAEVPLWNKPVAQTFSREAELQDGQKLLILTVPSGKPPRFFIEIGASLNSIRMALSRFLFFLALALPLIVLIAVGGGYVLIGAVLAPVKKITRSAERITSHNLTDRLPPAHTGDELEDLSIALNHMITRLDEAFQQNKRFIADASHELRTPLTIVRGELEAVLEQPELGADFRNSIGSVLEEVERLTKVVESLFALSRLDAGEAQAENIRFNLAEMAITTVEQMRLLADDKGVVLCYNAPQPVLVEGDRARLKQVVVNLVDNAIKYTPKGGAVRLSVQAITGLAALDVEDNGIGIPSEALPHVFDRFFRVDKGRSRELGGAGIGLAIVQSICAAHNGRATVTSQEGAGSRFRVELPLASVR